VKNSTLGKRAAATAVWAVMKAKTKIGLENKKKEEKSDEKTNTIDNKTWHHTYYIAIGN